jgi:SAM-dependent methyltransferase
MEISEIKISVKKYNDNISTEFYEDCLVFIKDFVDINKILENKYILESIRINLLYNDYYNLYICDKTDMTKKIEETTTWREFELSKKAIDNMFKQIYALESNDLKLLWCGGKKYSISNPVFVISKSKINISNFVKITNKIDTANLLLGVETIKILEHQDLKRFCEYNFSDKEEVNESTKTFTSFYNYFTSLELNFKERILVFSGMILHSLGTTYTRDVDLIYNGIAQSVEQINVVKESFNNFNAMIGEKLDYSIIYDDKIIKSSEPKEYLFQWIYNIWPGLVGKKNMIEVMADPEFHYYFMGIKLIGIDMTIKRLIKRASSSSFVDLLMLKKVNGYDSDVCFPNLSIRGGKITIYNDKEINKKLKIIQKYFKEWHDDEMSINDLKTQIVKCNELPHNVYVGNPNRFIYSSEITRYHNMILKMYIGKYFRGKKILDVGCGPVRDLYFYNSIKVPLFVGIEPSKYSIDTFAEINKDKKFFTQTKIIEGYGDEIWKNNPKYKEVNENKTYGCILFKFTIHYMLENFNILLKNIKSVDNDNTVIIVSCIDGDMVKKKLKESNGRYEIIFKGEPLYGIYDMGTDKQNNLKQVMVYFRGVYGVENGSIEHLISIGWLINKFSQIGYRVLENKNLLNVNQDHLLNIKNDLNEEQKKVSEIHRIIVFKKISNKFTKFNKKGGADINIDDFYFKYIKYKTKYLELKNKVF